MPLLAELPRTFQVDPVAVERVVRQCVVALFREDSRERERDSFHLSLICTLLLAFLFFFFFSFRFLRHIFFGFWFLLLLF